MQPELLKKYAQPVPRYTSYPTAPHFQPAIGVADYRRWLANAGPDASVYVHIPFCEKLCWYCGCNTKATQRYEPVVTYLEHVLKEMHAVSRATPADMRVVNMHWGGGSPSILMPFDILRLTEHLRRLFTVPDDAELAVELDPRNTTTEKVRAFASAGFNRVSVGVQDFDPDVQDAIGRHQGYEATAAIIGDCRDAGIRSINVDLVYGLPRQTRDTIEATIDRVIKLAPDRIALFGYAHLPSRLPHQRLIRDADLPGSVERFAQANRAANHLLAAGYVRIGLDHFARPGDRLARGPVHRNFQGYTTDAAGSLIGIGASSIGKLAEGYVQNAVPTADYGRRIATEGLAVVRGRALTAEDKARGAAIERLLCNLTFSAADLAASHGAEGAELADIGRTIIEQDSDGLVEAIGTDGSFDVTEKGRLFLRSICACFDAYLGEGTATHSTGV